MTVAAIFLVKRGPWDVFKSACPSRGGPESVAGRPLQSSPSNSSAFLFFDLLPSAPSAQASLQAIQPREQMHFLPITNATIRSTSTSLVRMIYPLPESERNAQLQKDTINYRLPVCIQAKLMPRLRDIVKLIQGSQQAHPFGLHLDWQLLHDRAS